MYVNLTIWRKLAEISQEQLHMCKPGHFPPPTQPGSEARVEQTSLPGQFVYHTIQEKHNTLNIHYVMDGMPY